MTLLSIHAPVFVQPDLVVSLHTSAVTALAITYGQVTDSGHHMLEIGGSIILCSCSREAISLARVVVDGEGRGLEVLPLHRAPPPGGLDRPPRYAQFDSTGFLVAVAVGREVMVLRAR